VREGFTTFVVPALPGTTAPLLETACWASCSVLPGDPRFLHGNLGEVTTAPSTESGLGCWYPFSARGLLRSSCGDGEGDRSPRPPSTSFLEPSSPGGGGVADDIVATTSGAAAAAPRISAARTAAMIRRSVLRSSSHFSSAPSSLRRFSAAVSGAASGGGDGGGGGGRVGSTTDRSTAAGDGGADSSRPMRRATTAVGGGRELSQLNRRCSGAIVGLRGASSQDRRLWVTAGCCGCCIGFVFTGERKRGDGNAASSVFFLLGVEDGGGGAAVQQGCSLAVRRFQWWPRWYGEKRRRRPAMHPTAVRLCAVEHADDDEARPPVDSGGGCIFWGEPTLFSETEAARHGVCGCGEL
jgi:hypothetical protein